MQLQVQVQVQVASKGNKAGARMSMARLEATGVPPDFGGSRGCNRPGRIQNWTKVVWP